MLEERGIYFMAFCFVQGTVGHFSSARAPCAVAAAAKTKMKNSTLAAKTIFYPLSLAFFHTATRPPVQSIPAIIASPSTHSRAQVYIYTRSSSTTPTKSCALKGPFFPLFFPLLFFLSFSPSFPPLYYFYFIYFFPRARVP